MTVLRHNNAIRNVTLLLLASMLCGSCGKRDPLPSHTQSDEPAPVAITVEQEATLSKDFFDAKDEAHAIEQFNFYKLRVKNSEFPGAVTAIKEIQNIYQQDSKHRSFWEKMIPREKRTRLTLLSVCSACKGGECPLCEGTGKCKICNGSGTCQHCKGDSVRKQKCWSCVCKICGGNGICRTCNGYGQIKCQTCGGHGSFEKRIETTCPRCGGSGSIEGLRGTLGPSRSRCLTCAGKGKISRTVMEPCSSCGGRGRVPCSACNQSCQCSACKGTGSTPNCPVCKGSGFTLHSCPICQGTGKCIPCAGNGLCPQCKGTVLCTLCKGGLIQVYEFIVNSDWLTMTSGFVFYDINTGKTTASDPFPGHKTVKFKDHSISFNVDLNHVVWISSSSDFESTRQLFKR